MASDFNPYLKWLGIPLKDQPPHHYRLLGVEPFEADADIIERAADRQMTYIRSLQNGEHAKAAQNLLNEISAAKVCLLNAESRQAYDHTLRKALQEVALPHDTALPMTEPLTAEPLAAEPVTAEVLPRAAAPPPVKTGPADEIPRPGRPLASLLWLGSGRAPPVSEPESETWQKPDALRRAVEMVTRALNQPDRLRCRSARSFHRQTGVHAGGTAYQEERCGDYFLTAAEEATGHGS